MSGRLIGVAIDMAFMVAAYLLGGWALVVLGALWNLWGYLLGFVAGKRS